jgi:hypothetical protein
VLSQAIISTGEITVTHVLQDNQTVLSNFQPEFDHQRSASQRQQKSGQASKLQTTSTIMEDGPSLDGYALARSMMQAAIHAPMTLSQVWNPIHTYHTCSL